MNDKPKWLQCQHTFYGSKEFLKKNLKENLYENRVKHVPGDFFSVDIVYRIKGSVNADQTVEPDKKHDFCELFSQLFYKKDRDSISFDQAQHRGEIMDNIMILLSLTYCYDFYPVKDLAFNNFSKDDGTQLLAQVDYQIAKVFELIQLKEIIDNPEKANITVQVKTNYAAFEEHEPDIREYYFDKEIISIEKIEEVFNKKYNAWSNKVKQLMVGDDNGYAILVPNIELTEEDITLAGNYAFTRAILLYYQQNERFYVQPTLMCLKYVYMILTSYKGRDNRLNKFYQYLGPLVYKIRSYLIEEWQAMYPNKKIVNSKLNALIVSFILSSEFIPEDNRLINLLEDNKSRKFIDDLIKNMK